MLHCFVKIISLVGLTASGKSALGIRLAQKFNGEIISADSRQVYRGLDIGTAKVTPGERALVPHHLLDVADPGTHFDVYAFQQAAYSAIADIASRGKLPIMVGGTGLYSRSVVENYEFSREGAGGIISPAQFEFLQICLLPSKDYIRPLVARRIDERMANGMIEETRGLLGRGVSRDWLRALGLEYYWNIELIKGRVTPEQYRESLLVKTMQYAKRQRTWFKKEKNTHFLTDPAKFDEEAEHLVREFLM
jgi:tRNA dimethylallyltransferase